MTAKREIVHLGEGDSEETRLALIEIAKALKPRQEVETRG